MLYSGEKAVRLSVRLSNACIVTKRKKDLSRFLHHTKDHLALCIFEPYGRLRGHVRWSS